MHVILSLVVVPNRVEYTLQFDLDPQVRSIYQNRKLITFYHEEEKPENFDAVMIKALKQGTMQNNYLSSATSSYQ